MASRAACGWRRRYWTSPAPCAGGQAETAGARGAWRRLVRAAPAGTAGLRVAPALGAREAVPAAAARHRVGVEDGEAGAHQAVDVIHLGALEVLRGEAVD